MPGVRLTRLGVRLSFRSANRQPALLTPRRPYLRLGIQRGWKMIRRLGALLAGAALGVWPMGSLAGTAPPLPDLQHIVVIYLENHSFDNLYGGWEGVNGRANATAGQMTQI